MTPTNSLSIDGALGIRWNVEHDTIDLVMNNKEISQNRNDVFSTHPRKPRGSQSGRGKRRDERFQPLAKKAPGYRLLPDHFRAKQVWRDNSRRVTTSKKNSRDAVRRLGKIIQNIFRSSQEPAFAGPFGDGPVRVVTQGLFRPCLKTFVAPFLPARLRE